MPLIQKPKEYQRHCKRNNQNELFVYYNKKQHSNGSPSMQPSRSRSSHQRIQDLRETLRGRPDDSAQASLQESKRGRGARSQADYNAKLDDLVNRLSCIANKSHFSPIAPPKNRTKSQILPPDCKRLDAPTTRMFHLENPHRQNQQHSRSFQQSNISKSSSFTSKGIWEQPVHNQIKFHGKGGGLDRGSRYMKADIVSKQMISEESLLLQNHPSKNLARIFQAYDQESDNKQNTYKKQEYNNKQISSKKDKTRVVFNQVVSKGRIAKIIKGKQGVAVAGRDFTILELIERDGEWEKQHLHSHRGGVTDIMLFSDQLFSCGLDYYLRAANYSHKFSTLPISLHSHLNSQLCVGTTSFLHLFDVQKHKIVSTFQKNQKEVICRDGGEMFLTQPSTVQRIDWRYNKLIKLIERKGSKSSTQRWICHPRSSEFYLLKQNSISSFSHTANGELWTSDLPYSPLSLQKSTFNKGYNQTHTFHFSSLLLLAQSESKTHLLSLSGNKVNEIDSQGDHWSAAAAIGGDLIYGDTQGRVKIKKGMFF